MVSIQSLRPSGVPELDDNGLPVLECMCGNILSGRFDPALPFFSRNGTFWTNSTTKLLTSTSEQDRQARTRNRCNGEGYESVALVSLRHGTETFGLLQLNDHAEGRFTPELIEFLEGIGGQVAIALAQRRALEALRESEERYRALVDATPIGVFVLEDGCFAYANPAGQKILGGDPALMGKAPVTDFVSPEFHEAISRRLARLEGGHPNPPMEIGILRADGQQIPIEGVSVPITWKGRPAALVVCQDISERKKAEADRVRLEQQLRQAQKMEAIGLLAGGVAHDFNNLLTVILGRTEMARMLLPGDSPLSQDLDLVAQAAQKGASLTRQLLAFARKQPMQRQSSISTGSSRICSRSFPG